jgi:hypothetical protein
VAFWIAFGLVLAAVAAAATVLRPQRPARAEDPAEATHPAPRELTVQACDGAQG